MMRRLARAQGSPGAGGKGHDTSRGIVPAQGPAGMEGLWPPRGCDDAPVEKTHEGSRPGPPLSLPLPLFKSRPPVPTADPAPALPLEAVKLRRLRPPAIVNRSPLPGKRGGHQLPPPQGGVANATPATVKHAQPWRCSRPTVPAPFLLYVSVWRSGAVGGSRLVETRRSGVPVTIESGAGPGRTES